MQQTTQPQAARTGGAAPLLELADIGVRLGSRQVLDDVSFSIEKGEFTGIIGQNGAGKTTLLRVILGLLEPTGGRVLIDGEPLHAKNKASIGYVPQKLLIEPDMPLRVRDVVVARHRRGTGSASRFPSRRPAASWWTGTLARRSAPTATPTPESASCPAVSSSGCMIAPRADQPAPAAAAGRAPGQPGHPQRPGASWACWTGWPGSSRSRC